MSLILHSVLNQAHASIEKNLLVLHLGLNILSNFLWLIRDWGKWGDRYLCPANYSSHCHHQNDYIEVGRCVRHFNVSLIVWANSQDGVHKPQFLKRKESQSGFNQGPSAY